MRKISFADYPEFTPNLTPRQMFQMGSFGGTYMETHLFIIKQKKL